ncbi:MAG: prepilin-type N-terminal cleavage/methylation domain-containing protein [Dehalococcoidia bacterium]
MKKVLRGEKGFTLVELLVVVAIMSVLIGVAVASFTGLIGSGGDESKDFELNAVQTAVDAYVAVTPTHTLAARTVAAEVTSADPFASYLRHLPTKYQYTWTAVPGVAPDPGGTVTPHY